MRRLVGGMAISMVAIVALSWAVADDREIASDITERLKQEKNDGTLQDFDISLKVAEGNVLLQGHVCSTEQETLALDIARNTDGVKRVINDLRVENGQQVAQPIETAQVTAEPKLPSTVSDQEIAGQIAASLRRYREMATLTDFKIDLSVDNGVVLLKGRVASEQQQQLVLDIAENATGVQNVVNHMVVRQQVATPPQTVDNTQFAAYETEVVKPTELTPAPATKLANQATNGVPVDFRIGEELTRQLRDAKRLGVLQGFGIGVHVENGTVWLKGRVSSANQKEFAEDMARGIDGVRDVKNELSVAEIPESGAPTAKLASLQMPQDAAPVDSNVSSEADTTSVHPEVTGPSRMAVTVPMHPSFHANSGMMPQATRPVVYPQMVPGGPAMGNNQPLPIGAANRMAYAGAAVLGAPVMAASQMMGGGPASIPGPGQAVVPARYDHPNLPGYAWPTYAAHPNYAAVTYPKQYSPTAWPYIGPFYPYPQVPLGWRKVTLKWDDGWWQLNFCSK